MHLPASRSRRISSRNARVALTSSPLVGSSSMRFCGSCTSARAIATFIRSPCEKPSVRRSRIGFISIRLGQPLDRCVDAVVAQAAQPTVVADVLAGGQPDVQAAGIGQHAEPLAHGHRLDRRCRGRRRARGPRRARTSVAIIRSVVVLPAPFGPSRPVVSPSAAAKDTPRTASTRARPCRVLRRRLWRRRTSRGRRPRSRHRPPSRVAPRLDDRRVEQRPRDRLRGSPRRSPSGRRVSTNRSIRSGAQPLHRDAVADVRARSDDGRASASSPPSPPAAGGVAGSMPPDSSSVGTSAPGLPVDGSK